MKTTLYLPCLAGLATLAAAAPADKTAGKFSVSQVFNAPRSFVHGSILQARAYRKFGIPVPEDIARAEKAALTKATTNGQGQVTATSIANDREYVCPVNIGGQTLKLDFDTGSSDLWVFSTEQPAAQSAGHTPYKCTKPKLAGETWKIHYGDGSGAHGNIVQDKVTVGGVTATNQAVECAQSVSAEFQQDKASDGLLGLAFPKINTAKPKKVKTFFQNIQAGLNTKVFAAALKYHAPGTYDFGFIDSSKHSGNIAYAPVSSSRGFFEFSVSGSSAGNAASNGNAFSAIADTGTSIILLNQVATVKAYYSQVPKAQFNNEIGGWIYPCSETLPNFNIFYNGAKATVPGQYIKYAVAGTASGVQYCFGGIQPAGSLPFSVLGDVFLVSQYAVFDPVTPRIGFAPGA